MFNPFSLFRPKHTFQKLAQELAEGLENGTIAIDDDAHHPEQASETAIATKQSEQPKPGS
jgi:hypothetical protein